jgi:hypothetical protein
MSTWRADVTRRLRWRLILRFLAADLRVDRLLMASDHIGRV